MVSAPRHPGGNKLGRRLFSRVEAGGTGVTWDWGSLKIERKTAGNVTILALIGEFDASSLPQVGETVEPLTQKQGTQLVLNLRRLEFSDSSALGYLIKTAKRLKELDGEFVLSEPCKFFQATIKTLGIDRSTLYMAFGWREDEKELTATIHADQSITINELDPGRGPCKPE